MTDTHFERAKKLRGSAKHGILTRYLNGWIPQIVNFYGTAVYVDGFAGTGKHVADGADGSPLTVLKELKKHTANIKHVCRKWCSHSCKTPTVYLIFIEYSPQNFQKLKRNVEEANRTIQQTSNFQIKIKYRQGDFNIIMKNYVLTKFGESPMFVFADPFGFNCKMSTLHSILESHREGAPKELLILLMGSYVRRFVRNPQILSSLNDLMGSDNWLVDYNKAPEDKKLATFYEMYTDKLKKGYLNSLAKKQKNLKAITFNIKGQHNNHIYNIVFATTHLQGVKKMKYSMGKLSQASDEYVFSEWIVKKNLTRDREGYEKKMMLQSLFLSVKEKFEGLNSITGVEIDEFITLDTDYDRTDRCGLKKMLGPYVINEERKFDEMEFSFTASSGLLEVPESVTHIKIILDKINDFTTRTAVGRILMEFNGKEVTGAQISEFFNNKVSSEINFKSNLKKHLEPFLKTFRIDQKTARIFDKMCYSLPPIDWIEAPPKKRKSSPKSEKEMEDKKSKMAKVLFSPENPHQ